MLSAILRVCASMMYWARQALPKLLVYYFSGEKIMRLGTGFTSCSGRCNRFLTLVNARKVRRHLKSQDSCGKMITRGVSKRLPRSNLGATGEQGISHHRLAVLLTGTQAVLRRQHMTVPLCATHLYFKGIKRPHVQHISARPKLSVQSRAHSNLFLRNTDRNSGAV